MSQTFPAILVLSFATFLQGQGLPDSPQSKSEDKQQFSRWVEHYQEIAATYDIRLGSARDHRLEVTAQPVHTYTNPSSGRDSHGAFFLWTNKGRPEAIGAIWSKLTEAGGSQRYLIHEFQSLSTEPLRAKFSSKSARRGVNWNPAKAGVDPLPVPDAPQPAASRRLRLAQMRSIARKFVGYHVHPTERQLRLLPQPLYRFETEKAEQDGAVFALFQEWDPEIILMLETRKTATGPQWHFCTGRFSDRPLRLEYQNNDVWRHGGGDFGDPSGPFFAVHGVSVRAAKFDLTN